MVEGSCLDGKKKWNHGSDNILNTGSGVKKISYKPKEGQKCFIHPHVEVKADDTEPTYYFESKDWIMKFWRFTFVYESEKE